MELSLAYRPERSAEFIQLIGDAIWLQFVGCMTPLLPGLLSLGVAALKHDAKVVVFPRWYGQFTLLATLLMLQRVMVFFHQSGPLSWNGVVGFWLPAIALLAWLLATTSVLRSAINHSAAPS